MPPTNPRRSSCSVTCHPLFSLLRRAQLLGCLRKGAVLSSSGAPTSACLYSATPAASLLSWWLLQHFRCARRIGVALILAYTVLLHSQAVYQTPLPCTLASRLSHSAISCILPRGAGVGWSIQVSIAGLTGFNATGALLNFDPPYIVNAESSGGNSNPATGGCYAIG